MSVSSIIDPERLYVATQMIDAVGIFYLMLCCTFIISLSFYTFQFYKLKHDAIYHKRYGNYVITISIFCISSLVAYLFKIVIDYPFVNIIQNPFGKRKDLVEFLAECIEEPSRASLKVLSVLRYYYIYNSLKLATKNNHSWETKIRKRSSIKSVTESALKSQLNRCNVCSRIFDNPRILKSILTAVFVVTVIFEIFDDFVELMGWSYAFGVFWYIEELFDDLIFNGLYLLSIWLMYLNLPKFYDSTYIYYEMKAITKVLSMLVIYLISLIIALSIKNFVLFQVFWIPLWLIFYFLTGFISTYWVLKKLPKTEMIYPSKNGLQLKKDVLSNYHLLSKFMKHLEQELSSELLLAYIEFYQFRSMINAASSLSREVHYKNIQILYIFILSA